MNYSLSILNLIMPPVPPPVPPPPPPRPTKKMDNANVGYSYDLPTGSWNYKIRNKFSQFSDLFSEFNKYIAPAYHHDRCERSVPMRIYSMHKGEFVMVFIAFFALFGLGIFIGLAGPPPTKMTSITASSVSTNTSTMHEGPFHLHSAALGPRAQQLWVFAEILTNNDDDETFDKSFQVSIAIEGVLADHTSTELVSDKDAPNKTQHLKCQKRACEEVQILHIGCLEYIHYVFNIKFHGLTGFHKRYYIRDIIFYFKTYNPAFTQLELWFRFIFVVAAVFVTFWFFFVLRKYTPMDFAIEQKWLTCLLPALVMANDTLYPLRLFPENCLASNMSDTSVNIFLSAMMMSWLSQYHGIRENNRSYTTFYLVKYLIVLGVALPAFIMTYWQKYVSVYEPTFNYKLSASYSVVKIIFFCALTLYFLYLLILIIMAYSDLRNMPFFDIRLRCLSIVVGSFILIMTILAINGWGPGALQDHWASQPKTYYDTSAPFMAMMGLFNFKIFIMAYLYAPGSGNIHDTAITKDNPAFSMINDSDEEVIYGSDEESRRPLNSHHRIADEDI